MNKLKSLTNTDEVFKNIKLQYQNTINKEIKKRFNIKFFELKELGLAEYYVKMDRHYIHVNIDQYNNLYLVDISGEMPLDYIKRFREFFNNYLENENSYNHRAGRGFMINYLRKYYKSVSKTLLENMCRLDDIDGEENSTFREWVYGSNCDYYIRNKFSIKADRW